MSQHTRVRRSPPKSTPAAPSLPSQVAPIVRAGTQGGGQSLDKHTQAEMSARFGHDFSQVRIHTDSHADSSAQEMGANAYTVGNDIVFREGQWTPGVSDSERLLAHELTHVVQQARAGGGDVSRASARADASEREADSLASQVMQGRAVDVQARPDAAVARDFWDDWKFKFTPKTSTDDTYDQRPGGAQDRDRKRQQEDDQREAQRRGETDPRPKWWDGLLGKGDGSPAPTGPNFLPKDNSPLPYDPNNPLHLPSLPGQPPPGPLPSAPAPTNDTPTPSFPPPFAPEIPGAPNPYDKDRDGV